MVTLDIIEIEKEIAQILRDNLEEQNFTYLTRVSKGRDRFKASIVGMETSLLTELQLRFYFFKKRKNKSQRFKNFSNGILTLVFKVETDVTV